MKLSYKALEEALENERDSETKRLRHSGSGKTGPRPYKVRKMRKY